MEIKPLADPVLALLGRLAGIGIAAGFDGLPEDRLEGPADRDAGLEGLVHVAVGAVADQQPVGLVIDREAVRNRFESRREELVDIRRIGLAGGRLGDGAHHRHQSRARAVLRRNRELPQLGSENGSVLALQPYIAADPSFVRVPGRRCPLRVEAPLARYFQPGRVHAQKLRFGVSQNLDRGLIDGGDAATPVRCQNRVRERLVERLYQLAGRRLHVRSRPRWATQGRLMRNLPRNCQRVGCACIPQ